MGLKLREIAGYVRTPEGILFRLGEIFLPVEGTDVAACFARLRLFLNGEWTAQQLCAGLSGEHRDVVARLINALLETGMLYDSSGDDPELLPEASRKKMAHLLTRIESRNPAPVRALAEALKSTLLLVAPAALLEVMMKAVSESGLSFHAVCARDWSAPWEETIRLKHAEEIHRLDLCSSAALAAMMDQAGIIMVGGEVDHDLSWIEKISAQHGREKRATMVPLLVRSDRVIAGPMAVNTAAGCLRCLLDCYEDQPPASGPLPHARKTASIGIAARLLAQRWLDVKTGMLSGEDETLFYELDCHTLQISLHPLLPSAICPVCSGPAIPLRSVPAEAPAEWPSDAFIAGARKFLVDSRSGIITRLDEGELLQLPFNQSAVQWRLPGERDRLVWTTEAAENVRAARMAVIQRCLEERLRLIETARDPASMSASSCGQNEIKADMSHDPGVVVSGVDPQQLATEAFFQSLAYHASLQGSWQELPSLPPTAGHDGMLVLHYLQDIGAFDKVRVSRSKDFSQGSCHVFRFAYNDCLVSVVAGLHEPSILSTGLKAVWLHLTRDRVDRQPVEFLPQVRYRFAVSPEGISLETSEIAALLGLHLTAKPLKLPELEWLAPLRFVHAFLVSADAAGDACQDESKGEFLLSRTAEQHGSQRHLLREAASLTLGIDRTA